MARNRADDLQEQQQQQQQQHSQQSYQQERAIKSHPNVVQTRGEDILLLMGGAQGGTAAGQQEGTPLISTVAAVLPPAITDLIKMEEYELPTVEL